MSKPSKKGKVKADVKKVEADVGKAAKAGAKDLKAAGRKAEEETLT